MNDYELTMNTVVDFKIKGSVKRATLVDIYNPAIHGDEDDFYAFVTAWLHTGQAHIVDMRTPEEQVADSIAEELLSVKKARTIQEDELERQTYKEKQYGTYGKVGFPAKTLMDAQDMHQVLLRNFSIKQEQLGVEMAEGKVIVTITDCPVKTYISVSRFFGVKQVTETVAGTVDKTAKGVVGATDIAINTVAVPITKTAVSSSVKVAKSIIGFTAKLGGIAIAEFSKGAKECATEIKNDAHIIEAKGEVTDGIHTIKRTLNSKAGYAMGGMIME